jgi:hypothetical protein
MGILDRYNKAISNPGGNLTTGIIRDPNTPIQAPDNVNFGKDNFQKSNLDLENPAPLGGPINIPYTTKIGSETVSKTTTQPYTPKNTYIDNLQSQELIDRARDAFK